MFILTLQAEALLRDNDVSAHAQNVAKAKYEFLFGLEEEKPSGTGKCYLLLLYAKKKKKSLKPLRKVLQKLLAPLMTP